MRMHAFTTVVAFGASTAVLAQPLAADRPGRPVSFVVCPQFRNTARQCWVAEVDGKTYYIGNFRIGTPPELLHRALVEGTAHDGETSCGAINIDPVQISPLAELDSECDTVLPDNGSRPLEPSVFDLPAEVLARNGADVAAPPPILTPTTFTIVFDFDGTRLNLANQAKVEMIARAIMASQVERVIVTGYAGEAHPSNAPAMVEEPAVATERAAIISNALKGIGVAEGLLKRRSAPKAAPVLGRDAVASRKVTVDVVVRDKAKP